MLIMRNNLFITFEGGEGSGKSTIIEFLKERLEKKYELVLSREPGGVKISEDIRKIILDPENTLMCEETEALLFAASRMQHLKEKVIPALKDGKIVLCDRYIDSSLVYQGYSRGLGFDKVLNINSFACNYMPLVTFFIDVTPEVGFQRIKGRNCKIDRLDKETMDFYEKVYEGYLELCEMYPERIVRINGDRNVEEIVGEIYKIIISKIEE